MCQVLLMLYIFVVAVVVVVVVVVVVFLVISLILSRRCVHTVNVISPWGFMLSVPTPSVSERPTKIVFVTMYSLQCSLVLCAVYT